MKKGSKILILVPHFTARGGITNYYKTLKDLYSLDIIYFNRGAKKWPYRKNETIRAVLDILKFVRILIKEKICLVQTSTSLSSFSFFRDSVFILIAKIFRVQTIIFFRGWKDIFWKNINNNIFYKRYFKFILSKTDALIVLAEFIKNELITFGYKKSIYKETTLVDESLISDLTEAEIKSKYESIKQLNILYLARIEPEKGIYEAIKTFKLISNKYKNLYFNIVGDGKELAKAKSYAKEIGIINISFLGHLEGIDKKMIYKHSHIYFFPSYSEGMPNSVLEAMAFGLPIITRNVGGLSDFFKNELNGFITNTFEPEEFKLLFDNLIYNSKKMTQISINNFCYAKEVFYATRVVDRLEKIFLDTIQN